MDAEYFLCAIVLLVRHQLIPGNGLFTLLPEQFHYWRNLQAQLVFWSEIIRAFHVVPPSIENQNHIREKQD